MGEFLDKYFEQEPLNVQVLESVEEVFSTLTKLCAGDVEYFFRGVSDSAYGLQSSLERTAWDSNSERFLMEEFNRKKQEYLRFEDYPSNEFEALALMQHFGAPTRLIDVTRSPFVGLYFATNKMFKENEENKQKDGALYTFMYWNLHSASIRNLQKSNIEHKIDYNWISRQLREDPELYQKCFLKMNDNLAFFLEPYKMNTRLSIQQGLFLVTNARYKKNEELIYNLLKGGGTSGENGADPTIMKYIIPYKLKKDILKRLYTMNINSTTLFPGLEGFFKHLMEKNIVQDVLEKSDIHKP